MRRVPTIASLTPPKPPSRYLSNAPDPRDTQCYDCEGRGVVRGADGVRAACAAPGCAHGLVPSRNEHPRRWSVVGPGNTPECAPGSLDDAVIVFLRGDSKMLHENIPTFDGDRWRTLGELFAEPPPFSMSCTIGGA